jgi:single-strand DNA-binding protein
MYQKITIVGNLGDDPKKNVMQDGSTVANFSVATNRRWKNAAGEKQEETAWFRVSAFRQLGDNCYEYLAKGRQVLVDGRLKPDEFGGPRIWTAQDGTVRASFEITALDVRFLGGGSLNGEQASASKPAGEQSEEDEIPF